MTEIVENITKRYYKPTPKKWRKIGDTITDVSIIVATIAFFTPAQWITPVSMMIGRIGKIITNLASE
jgi:hypothetical protein